MFRLTLLVALTWPAFAFAGASDGVVEHTRDEHYIYSKMPFPLTFDDEQVELIKSGLARAQQDLKALFPINPRVGKAEGSLLEASNTSTLFGTKLDQLVVALQKNYGTLATVGLHGYNMLPTAVVLYGGVAIAGTKFLTIGGSATIGVVAMLKKVWRTKIDTGVTDEYVECAANLFVWGSALFGPPAAIPVGKRAFPVGFGFVFGTLAKPEDLTGVTGTVNLRSAAGVAPESKLAFFNPFVQRMVWKISFVKNVSKSGWPSNVMLTGAYLIGDPEAFTDPFASLSYIGDFQSWVHGGLDMLQGAGQKFFGVTPPVQVEKLPGASH